MWKLSEMSYLKSFYRQRAKSGRRGSRSSRSSRNSDEDDGGHESSASSRQETPTKSRPEVPHPLLDQPSRRPRRLTDDSTSSEGPSGKLGQIVEVMRDSASNLVCRSKSSSLDNQEQERLSFYQWMFESTRKIPTERWRQYQAQVFNLAMSFSSESAQGNPSTAQASQGSSTSSLPVHPQYQRNPPATHPPPASAGVDRLHPHPTEMVSKLSLVFLSMLLTKLFMFLDN